MVSGVYTVRKNAEYVLSLIKEDGYSNASILERGKRLDVYIDVFDTNKDANDFAQKVMREHPEYEGAWVLKY